MVILCACRIYILLSIRNTNNLQLGGEVLRPDGLSGVNLTSFILLSEKLANVLHGVFIDTREGTLLIGGVGGGWVVVSMQHLKKQKVRISQD